MPSNKKIFSVLAWTVFAYLFWIKPAYARDLLYTEAEAECAAKIIFMNECSGKDKNLLYWSPNEPFPSLGIGHFIWYPEQASGPYRESFPGLLHFIEGEGMKIPKWISDMPIRYAPWHTREEFEKDLESPRGKELFEFLRTTKHLQAQYILRRFRMIFPTILDDMDEADREPSKNKYDLLMQTPAGAFAMIDYVNFKGEGFRSDARYEGIGWGLAQVLIEMKVPDDPKKALDEFIAAAERVLKKRVSLAPRAEIESQWLPGWKNRIHGYKKIEC